MTSAPGQAAARSGERGAVMILVMTVLAALLAGGAVTLYVQLASTRAAGYASRTRRALFCAEAGLAAARPLLGQNYALWPDLLDGDPANDPPWYPLQGDIDGDGTLDYQVTIRDDDDELPPLANDPGRDNNLKVFVDARCIRYPDTSRQVLELVLYQGGGSVYRNQSGQGSGQSGNAN